MYQRQKGFTLIELITVIVILGALAVIALPRFINLQDEADAAALDGVAGALGAGAAVNLAGELAGDGAQVSVADCTDVANTLADGLPTGYTITSAAIAAPTGNAVTCSVNQTSTGNSANFTGYHVP